MFKRLFDPDNALMITMARITDCIFLSLFWLLGSFPVLTAAVSTAALYDAVYYGFRKKDRHPWTRFLKSYRRNLLPGLLPGLTLMVCLGALGFGMIKLWNASVGGSISWGVFAGAAFVSVVLLGMLSVLAPMLSRFENSFGTLLKNTVLLSLANLPRTVILGILNAAVILVCIRFVFPVFFLPGVAALLGSFLIEPMFKPYLPEETE